eukprot:scaffold322663_cov19-Tisochrysis_lutea.AAC.1
MGPLLLACYRHLDIACYRHLDIARHSMKDMATSHLLFSCFLSMVSFHPPPSPCNSQSPRVALRWMALTRASNTGLVVPGLLIGKKRKREEELCKRGITPSVNLGKGTLWVRKLGETPHCHKGLSMDSHPSPVREA